MFKSILRGAGISLSFLSLGSMATAGSLAEGVADPQVEDLVIEEESGNSIGILPIIGLLVVGALIISSGGGDDGPTKEEPPVTK
ncbi:MAG: hypothetical protein LJE62_09705 [Silicimonas sp.]|jgi:hypothetical protein|nr:hypothetical protein [Silicimonas sp.]